MANTQAIDHVLCQAVHRQDVPGVVAMAATDQGVIYEGAYGTRALGTNEAMRLDRVVWIASMTKAITAAAAMQLVERGQLWLDAPAADIVPALAQARVLEGFDASGTPQLRAPARAITLRHLLTHTANFFPGMPQHWGLSFLINTTPTPQGRAPGSLAWAGLANTFFWIDPAKRVTGVFVTQLLPFFDPKAIALFRAYETALYQAL